MGERGGYMQTGLPGMAVTLEARDGRRVARARSVDVQSGWRMTLTFPLGAHRAGIEAFKSRLVRAVPGAG